MSEPSPQRPFKRVGLIAKPNDARVGEILPPLLDFLQQRGLDVVLDQICAALLHDVPYQTFSPQSGDGRDLVISIGGDGTLLRTAHCLLGHDVRLLGINLGTLGFLTDISPLEIPERLTEILDGEYIDERRPILNCGVSRDGQTLAEFGAINDLVIHHWNIPRLIRLDTFIDGNFVHSQRSDGIIVSTPTGSTAYALSGGGPILHPSLDALLLVPVCPHTLSNRPLVVADRSTIEIVVGTQDHDHARLTCDGEVKLALAPGDRVSVEIGDKYVHLVHPPGYDHYATLRAKLHWG